MRSSLTVVDLPNGTSKVVVIAHDAAGNTLGPFERTFANHDRAELAQSVFQSVLENMYRQRTTPLTNDEIEWIYKTFTETLRAIGH